MIDCIRLWITKEEASDYYIKNPKENRAGFLQVKNAKELFNSINESMSLVMFSNLTDILVFVMILAEYEYLIL